MRSFHIASPPPLPLKKLGGICYFGAFAFLFKEVSEVSTEVHLTDPFRIIKCHFPFNVSVHFRSLAGREL